MTWDVFRNGAYVTYPLGCLPYKCEDNNTIYELKVIGVNWTMDCIPSVRGRTVWTNAFGGSVVYAPLAHDENEREEGDKKHKIL